jgi:glycerol-3-phosphate O-acyltransferase
MVSIIPVSNFTGKLPDQRMTGAIRGDMIQGIEQASGGIVFGSTVQIAGEAVTRTDKDATALVDVVRFLTGMVQTNRDKPEMARIAALLDTMSLQANANTLSFSLSVPESDLEQMLKPPVNHTVRRVSIQK